MNSPIPRPGGHLPGPPTTIDPAEIREQVSSLLAQLEPVHGTEPGESASVLSANARLLEQAHDVLVNALAHVDKS